MINERYKLRSMWAAFGRMSLDIAAMEFEQHPAIKTLSTPSPEYPENWFTEIRKFVIERDLHQCRLCDNFKEEFLLGIHMHHVHHIDHDKQNNDYANLISLCPRCHTIVHKDDPEGWKIRLKQIVAEVQNVAV